MRANRIAMFVLLLSSPPAFAQSDDLSIVLRGWEKALADAKTISCEIRRQSDDRALKTIDTYDGGLIFAKAGGRQRFRFELSKGKNLSEKMIADGKDLYEYVP